MPFAKGQSGNPKGAPKKEASIRGCLRASMAETIEVPQKDGTTKAISKGEFLSSKLFQIAASGDIQAIKLCLDNVDGPPVQTVETITITQTPLDPSAASAAAKQAEEAGEV